MNDSINFGGESPENYEQKCLCVLVVDVSGSMKGAPIDQLNEGLKMFQEELVNDFVASQRVEMAIVSFGSTVNLILNPSLSTEFEMPTLSTSGSTKLVDGVRMAINVVEERKSWYKSTGQTYYRPWIMLITDGEPDQDQDLNSLAAEIRQKVDAKGFLFYTIGVEGFNSNKLELISYPSSPKSLKGLAFRDLFKWLSASIAMVSKSSEGDKITLPPTTGWEQIEI